MTTGRKEAKILGRIDMSLATSQRVEIKKKQRKSLLSGSLFPFKVKKSISEAAFMLMTLAAAIVCNF